MIANPINDTQRHFNAICRRTPAGRSVSRSAVQDVLARSGQQLNAEAYAVTAEHLTEFADRNPWHVCYAIALAWGHLALLELDWTDAATSFLAGDGSALRAARTFHYERGPEPIEQSLRGGLTMFGNIVLPEQLPRTISICHAAQQRWLGRVIGPQRPPYIGAWNATAIFMVSLFAAPTLAATLLRPDVLLPPGGPVHTALTLLHSAGLLTERPSGNDLDDAGFEPGVLYEKNALIEEVLQGHANWHMIDVHSGLYMLGTRWAESGNWVNLGPEP